MTTKQRGFQPGRTKTGGRTKGSGGRRIFVTVPPEIKLPTDESEARAAVIDALRKYLGDALPPKV